MNEHPASKIRVDFGPGAIQIEGSEEFVERNLERAKQLLITGRAALDHRANRAGNLKSYARFTVALFSIIARQTQIYSGQGPGLTRNAKPASPVPLKARDSE